MGGAIVLGRAEAAAGGGGAAELEEEMPERLDFGVPDKETLGANETIRVGFHGREGL